MEQIEIEEDFLKADQSAASQPQVRPTSSTLICISSLADLQPNTVYCDTQDVLDHVNLADSQPVKDAAKIIVPHTLSLELLHYFGPYKSELGENYVYVASIENDNSHIVLVSHYGDIKENAQMDNFLNRIFKIKNFMTICSKDVTFDCGDIECEIADKPLFNIAIVTSEALNSTLEFNGSYRELTKLSEVVNPSNKAQVFNFVNVIGFVEVVIMRSNKIDSIIISEEDTKNFRINLGYCQLDQLKQNPHQNDIEKVFFSPSDRSLAYPPLAKGDLVCIRDLCLGTGPINIVVHPDQLSVIKPYKSNLILQDNKFSDNEIKRIHELLTGSANMKVQNPVPYKIGNHNILDFCGQVLAKLEKSYNNKLMVELFLLLPYKSSSPTFLSEKSAFIVEYISRNCSRELNIYTQEIINELVENNRIVKVSLYGDNAESSQSANIFNLILLINVHLKKDNFYSGFFQYIMHEGRDNGKGCFVIDEDSILGDKILKSIKELNQELFPQPSENENYMSEEDLDQHFDDEIVNRYNGPENLLSVAESQKKRFTLYENAFKDIVQANIRETSLKGQRAIIKCYINEQISMRVNSFAEMVEEIQNGLEETIVVGQNATIDGTPLSQKTFFLITGRMINYIFEDEFGLPITDMFTFRNSLIKFYCTNPACYNKASYLSVAPQISRIIALGDDRPNISLRCSKCEGGSMGLYLTLKFTIEDSHHQKFTCLLTSPEAEEFIGVTSQQLMFTIPRSGDICKAVETLLQTFCPYRCPLSSTTENGLNSTSNDSPRMPLNPNLEWIIQYVQKEDANESISADFLNGHMFDLNVTTNGTQIRHFFYIRGISELSQS